MRQVERDLDTRLDWVAVDHYNTGHPHTHIVIRGKDEAGRDLVIARDYIAHGMRARAVEILTEELGPRTDREIEQAMRNEVSQERFTYLDRELVREAEDGVFGARHEPGDRFGRFKHALKLRRLQQLSRMGLAHEHAKGFWRLSPQLEETLRRIGERGDLIRTMQRHMREAGHERLDTQLEIYDSAGRRANKVVGPIVDVGLYDELRNRHYLVLDGTDGRTHYVRVGEVADPSDLTKGAIVEISPRRAEPRQADRTIASIAEANGGVYSMDAHAHADPRSTEAYRQAHVRRLEALRRANIVARRPDGTWIVPENYLERAAAFEARADARSPVRLTMLSYLPLERLVAADGATWLDHQLVSGEVQEALNRRRAYLIQEDLVQTEAGRTTYRQDMLNTLRQRELRRVAAALTSDLGKTFVAPEHGGRIEGVYRSPIKLASGKFALIEKSQEFTLVPWREVLEHSRGRQVVGILGNDGLVRVPRLAAGLELPWGGPSGINEKVVNQAITDYLAVHPYLNSLEVDVRSVSAAPRAREIDDALVRAVGGATVREVALLGGATRIWDSDNRLGGPPSRDRLLTQRDAEWRDRPFEWRRYPASTNTPISDVALIENASAHMGAVQATTTGVLGPLPLRRFTVPAISGQVLDQQYAAFPGDDVLGLSQLLAEIEHALPSGAAALRVAPQANALGIGSSARWEVLGTLNIDPALLSNTIRAGGHADRMLWEWRPSWLTSGQGDRDELGKRAHYVVARVPASLTKALASRQGLAEPQAQQMVVELGRRGIGLASLQAAGGTQESAAAGHFYATRLLFPPPEHSQPQNWVALSSSTFAGLLPIDPIAPILSAIAGESPRRRADLLVFKVAIEGDAVRVGIIPIEVKHHGQPQQPSRVPAENDPELKRAREQLKDAAKLVQALSAALDPGSELARDPAAAVARRQACAALLDLALSFADEQVDPSARAIILRCVVQGRVVVDAGPAMLLWFAPGSITTSGAACIVRPDADGNCEAFIDPTAVPGTWWPGNPLGPDDALVRTLIDDAISTMLAVHKEMPTVEGTDLSAALLAMLGLTRGTPGETGPTGATGDEPGGTEPGPPAHDLNSSAEVPEPSVVPPVAATEATGEAAKQPG